MPVASTLARAQILPPDPAEVGKWVTAFNHPQNGDPTWPLTFNAIHMALIPVTTPGVDHRGHVVVWDETDPPATQQRWAILDPQTKTFWNFRLPLPNSNVAPGDGDIFCSAHTWTARGDLFVAGGSIYSPNPPHPLQSGSKLAYLWDPTEWNLPATNRGWYRQPDMLWARYYPGALRQGNDGMVVAGGVDTPAAYSNHDTPPLASNYEVFHQPPSQPHLGAWEMDSQGVRLLYPGPVEPLGDVFQVFPRLHLLIGLTGGSIGWMFYSGFGKDNGRVLHTPGSIPTWDHSVGHTPLYLGQYRQYLHYGTSIVQPIDLNVANPALDRVMRFGGGLGLFNLPRHGALAVNMVETCDTRASGSAKDWQPFTPSMNDARMFLNSVILPDGSVLVIGGMDIYHVTNPRFAQNAEFLRNGVWTRTAAMFSTRGYHSVALLLPDGRVLVGGGNDRDWDFEIYEPTYFYTGTRPTIGSAPASMSYGGTYLIGYDLPSGSEYVQKVVLTRPGCVTHHSCSDQRYIALQQVNQPVAPPEGFVQFKAPPDSRYAPRGWYLLWLVTNFGTPSVASWVELKD